MSETKDEKDMEETPKVLLGRYRDLVAVGRGGMGVVYRAWDEQLGRTVALKVIQSRLGEHGEARKRFEREVRSMAAVEDEHVVRVYDFHQSRRSAVIAMEYVEGRSLKALLKERDLDETEAVAICTGLARALVAVHESGVVHRDIKPANIMIGDDGAVKLMDFGLVRFEDDVSKTALTRSGQIVGTLRYLPPEVYAGRSADVRGDLYQLGLVFFECITGELPLRGRSVKDMIDGSAYRELVEACRDDAVPVRWRPLLESLLSASPAARPETARSVLDAFLAEGAISAPRPARALQRPPTPAAERDEGPPSRPGSALTSGRRDAVPSSPSDGRGGRPRRVALLFLVLAGLALAAGAWWWARPTEGATRILSLERIPGFASLLLTWTSDAPSVSLVEYGRLEGKELVGRRRVLSPTGEKTTRHRIVLAGLAPGAQGAFRIRLGGERFTPLYTFRLPEAEDPRLDRRWVSPDELALDLSFPVELRPETASLVGSRSLSPTVPETSARRIELRVALPPRGEWTELFLAGRSRSDERREWRLPLSVMGLEDACARLGEILGPRMEEPVQACVERLFARARELRSSKRDRFETLLAGNDGEAGDGLARIGPRRRAEVLLNREHRADFLPLVRDLEGLDALRSFRERCPDPFAARSLSPTARLGLYRALGPLFVLDRAMEHLLAETPVKLDELCRSYVDIRRESSRDYARQRRELEAAGAKGPDWALPLFVHDEGWEYFRVVNRHFGGAMAFMGLMGEDSSPMSVFKGFRPDRVRDHAEGVFTIDAAQATDGERSWEIWLGGCNLSPAEWIEVELRGPFDEEPLPVRFYNDTASFLGPQTPATGRKNMRKRFIVARLPPGLLFEGRWRWSLRVRCCRNTLAGLTVAEVAFLRRGPRPGNPGRGN